MQTLQEELLKAAVLSQDYDFEAHKQLVPMQPGDEPTTYADAKDNAERRAEEVCRVV